MFFLYRKREKRRDFPGSPVVKNPPSNAGEASLICGRETQIPLATEQLSLYAATSEPAHQSWGAQELCRPHAVMQIQHAATKAWGSQRQMNKWWSVCTRARTRLRESKEARRDFLLLILHVKSLGKQTNQKNKKKSLGIATSSKQQIKSWTNWKSGNSVTGHTAAPTSQTGDTDRGPQRIITPQSRNPWEDTSVGFLDATKAWSMKEIVDKLDFTKT